MLTPGHWTRCIASRRSSILFCHPRAPRRASDPAAPSFRSTLRRRAQRRREETRSAVPVERPSRADLGAHTSEFIGARDDARRGAPRVPSTRPGRPPVGKGIECPNTLNDCFGNPLCRLGAVLGDAAGRPILSLLRTRDFCAGSTVGFRLRLSVYVSECMSIPEAIRGISR